MLPVNALCPITAGSYDTGLVPFTISRVVQPGTYVLRVQMTDQTSSTVLLADLSMSLYEDSDLALTGVPANITTNAAGPTGAVVNYTAPTATDEDSVETPTVGCLPASGSPFATGTTTVTCTATDADDLNSPVHASFTVTVTGALGQLQALLASVAALPSSTARTVLGVQLGDAVAAEQAGNTSRVCLDLFGLVRAAEQEQSYHQLTAAQATSIINAANQMGVATSGRLARSPCGIGVAGLV